MADCATYRIASKRSRSAALPASITAAGSRPSCRYSPGLRRATCARMMAARCGPRRANFDAILNARGQSLAAMAACTFESLVCNPASCGRRLYRERARTSRRGTGVSARIFAQARPRARLRRWCPASPPHRGFIRGLVAKCSKYNNDINAIRRLRQPPGVRAPRTPRFSALRSLWGGRMEDGVPGRRKEYGRRSVGFLIPPLQGEGGERSEPGGV